MGRSIEATAGAEAGFDALAYALFVRDLMTGDGDDGIVAEASASGGRRADARGLSIGDTTGAGFFGPGSADLGAGNDSLIARATASVAAPAGQGGILAVSASGVTVDLESALSTGAGNDTVDLTATATAGGQGASPKLVVSASGLENLGAVRLGDGNDTVVGRGTANADGLENRATLAFGVTQITGDGSNAGLIDTSADSTTTDNDTLRGEATATGDTDVNAFGVLLTNAAMGRGTDTVEGKAVANGKDFAQASGVAIGVSNNVPGQTSLLPDEAGTLLTGAGRDSIIGDASATTSSGAEALFNDVDAVLVDLGSVLRMGPGMDTITGTASAVDAGLGGGAFSAVVADGIENRGTLRTGAGDDVINGSAKTSSNQAFSVAGGIDNGLGSTQNGIPVTPLLDTGNGADRLTGTSVSSAVGANAFAGGIENFGTIRTGADGDILMARAESKVSEGEAGDLSNADGIDNRFRIETGSGDDLLDATVTATAMGGDADAIGIRNDLGGEADNVIDLGSGGDRMIGVATATANNGNAMAVGISGGTVITDPDASPPPGTPTNDVLEGTANAIGAEDVGATGILLIDARTGAGADRVTGVATANGEGSADAFGIAVDGRGISVGLSDIDDDTLQNPDDPGSPPARVGILRTGGGADILEGTANVTADVGLAEDIFFANATGITNDGGTLAQLEELLEPSGFFLTDLANAVNGEVVPGLLDAIEAVLPDLDTSTLDTGGGNDTIDVKASITVTGGLQGGDPSGEGDPDLEVFVEGIENSGQFLTGGGDDHIIANVSGTSVGGAKILVEGIDNSGVGVSTGLNLDDQVNQQTLLDMGAGNDTITVNTTVRGEGDLAAGDGIDARSNLDMGSGDDSIVLNVRSEFVRTPDAPGDQEEGIADGIENRNNVFLGEGNDSVTATVQAFGNGVLTIAEGIESRGLFDAGPGIDEFNLTATATSTEGVLADNLTQAAGLQTEQVTSGTFLLGDGDDTVIAKGVASSDGLTNKATLAFGITQVTADASDVGNDLSVGEFDAGSGNDTLSGEARATGENEVEAFGVLFTNGMMGAGSDMVTGTAMADGKDFAQANGVAVGVSDNVPGQTSLLPDEAGTLRTGAGNDVISGRAHATTDSGTEALFNDADAVLVDLDSVLDTGQGMDMITGKALAVDVGHGGGAFSAVVADGFENRGTVHTGAGNDIVEGHGESRSNQAFSVAGGIDNGLGSTQNGIPVTPLLDTGDGLDRLMGSSVSSAVGANAFAGGIENFGTIRTGADGDTLMARAESKVSEGEAGDLSNADGIDNRFRIETGSGDDLLQATVAARAEGGDADAIGIRNDLGGEADNVIDLGSGSDRMIGVATATANNGNAMAVGISGGTVITDPDASPPPGTPVPSDDLVSGIATATGTEDVGAFGVLITNTTMGAGCDTLIGIAEANGAGSAEAFGIAVGTAGFANLPDESGFLHTGAEGDVLIGSATANAEAASAFGVSIADGSMIRTGGGSDSITGTASASISGSAELAGLRVGTGPGAGGMLVTGGGADRVSGEVLLADDVFADIAAGILIEDGAQIRTGGGADVVTGTAPRDGTFAGPAFGIAGGGQLRTGAGDDEVFASSFGGGVQVFAGTGDDTVTGFGNARVNGGAGSDTLVIDFDFFGQGGEVVQPGNQTNFMLGDVTLVTLNFEQFNINGVLIPPGEFPIA